MIANEARTNTIDTRERGATKEGQPQFSDQRLFMQLLAFDCAKGIDSRKLGADLCASLQAHRVPAVVYEDVNNPRGFAVLSFTEHPALFTGALRNALNEPRLGELTLRPSLTMIGRTYSTGFEADLEYWLLRRPRETIMNEAWNWAIWYPLRRKGPFERLEQREKGGIMREHGGIGRAYAEGNLAHDVRLACHGLDENDNDFVIGLLGEDLFPLSHVVHAMRSTRQTAEYMDHMGPFFVGRAIFRNS